MEPGCQCHTLQAPNMPSEHQTLGVCPECGADIPSGSVLLEYEQEGERSVYAECPDCVEPVHPA